MRHLVFSGPGALQWQECPEPQLREPRDALVRPLAVARCDLDPVIALGLYSLFVDDEIPMPKWLRVRNLGDLKELLASVVIVVVAVIFLGFALTWDGVENLLIIGLSSAAVIAALALFLWTTGKERAHQDELELRRAESRHAHEAAAVQRDAAAAAGPAAPGKE